MAKSNSRKKDRVVIKIKSGDKPIDEILYKMIKIYMRNETVRKLQNLE